MGRGALQGEEVTCKQDLCSGRRGLNAKSLWLEVREEEVGLGECGEHTECRTSCVVHLRVYPHLLSSVETGWGNVICFLICKDHPACCVENGFKGNFSDARVTGSGQLHGLDGMWLWRKADDMSYFRE